MSKSSEYFERSQKVAPGGVHSPVRAFKSVGGTPIFFKSAKGAYLQSVDDQTYIDYCMSFGPMILGHLDPVVSEAVQKQIQTAWSFGACEPYSLELAEWITSRLPHVEKLRFVASGTEAVMSALRVARAATGRRFVLKFDGCYHGHVDSMLVKSGSGLAGEASSDSAGVSANTASETLVCSLDDEATLEQIFATRGNEIAAVAIEPLPANYGLLIQRKEFIQKIFTLAKKHGALVLLDEVISGFRVGLGGMSEILGVKPDLVCFGKILGGGFNVGCYAGRKDLMDLVAPNGPVYQAGTLSASPVGMVAGLTTLKRIVELNVYEVLSQRMNSFVETLKSEFRKKEINMTVTHFGSLFWIHQNVPEPIRTIEQIPVTHKAEFAKLFHGALQKGIYLAPSGYEVGFISYAHTDAILQETAQKIIQVAEANR